MTRRKSNLDDRTDHIMNILAASTGSIAIFLGFVLFMLGLSGSMQVVVEGLTLKARITNASPGAVLAFLGTVIILRYKPRKEHIRKRKSKIEKSKNGESRTEEELDIRRKYHPARDNPSEIKLPPRKFIDFPF